MSGRDRYLQSAVHVETGRAHEAKEALEAANKLVGDVSTQQHAHAKELEELRSELHVKNAAEADALVKLDKANAAMLEEKHLLETCRAELQRYKDREGAHEPDHAAHHRTAGGDSSGDDLHRIDAEDAAAAAAAVLVPEDIDHGGGGDDGRHHGSVHESGQHAGAGHASASAGVVVGGGQGSNQDDPHVTGDHRAGSDHRLSEDEGHHGGASLGESGADHLGEGRREGGSADELMEEGDDESEEVPLPEESLPDPHAVDPVDPNGIDKEGDDATVTDEEEPLDIIKAAGHHHGGEHHGGEDM